MAAQAKCHHKVDFIQLKRRYVVYNLWPYDLVFLQQVKRIDGSKRKDPQ